VGAITIEEREAAPYDEAAVQKNMEARTKEKASTPPLACGCPGSAAKAIRPQAPAAPVNATPGVAPASQLRQWPCQLQLVPVNAPYLHNAHILIAADCAAYAYANFHQDFMRNKITLIGCPKLDLTDYSEKLTAILRQNTIKSLTVIRMEVPCCGGLVNAVKKALFQSEKLIPWQIVTIGTDGAIEE
jgi:hypothetical protein